MVGRQQNRASNGGYNFASVLNNKSVLSAYELGQKVQFTVRILKQLYRKEETGWSIYLVEMNDWSFKMSGVFIAPLPLENYYMVIGKISEYNGERCLSVVSYTYHQPEDETAIIDVLRTIEELNIDAPRVYRKYGKNILKDLMKNPQKVAKIIGFSEEKVAAWSLFLNRHQESEEIFEVLKKYGLSDTAAKTLWEKYGSQILEMIAANPYFLIDEVPNVTFKKCDAKALENGYAFDGVSRVSYGMLSVLKTAAAAHGHCYLPANEFMRNVHHQLNISLNAHEAAKLLSEGEVISITKNGVQGTVKMPDLRLAMDEWQGSNKKVPLHITSRSCQIKQFRMV